jgi:hypothetical protein
MCRHCEQSEATHKKARLPRSLTTPRNDKILPKTNILEIGKNDE